MNLQENAMTPFKNNKKPQTVDSVLETFSKTLQDLDLVHDENLRERDRHKEMAKQSEVNAELCEVECTRAQRVRSKLKEILD